MACPALERRLLQLIDEHGGQISMSEISIEYPSAQFTKDLQRVAEERQRSSIKLKSVLTHIPSLDRVQRKIIKNGKATNKLDWFLVRAPGSTNNGNGTATAANHTTTLTNSQPAAPKAKNATPNATNIILIDTVAQLQQLSETNDLFDDPCTDDPCTDDPFTTARVVALDVQGTNEALYLVQIATEECVYVLDCVTLGALLVGRVLQPLLRKNHVGKLVHQGHKFASLLSQHGGIDAYRGWMDIELLVEAWSMTESPDDAPVWHSELDDWVRRHPSSQARPWAAPIPCKQSHGKLYAERPLPNSTVQSAVARVRRMLDVWKERDDWPDLAFLDRRAVQRASDARMQHASQASTNTGAMSARHICFDVAHSYHLASWELLREVRPQDMLHVEPLVVSNETSTLLDMLPEDLANDLIHETEHLSDIVLDKGRTPHAWVGGERLLLGGDGRMVDATEIMDIVLRLGGFGTDNRAGLAKQLHRISAVRNRETEIIGLTMRVGRHISGNATMIADLLFGESAESILFLGEPGSGKTTVVREVTRLLAERQNVCIVDTSNEIAGDGDIPHPCVGMARRMMVPSLDHQSAVMIECVQNHTPSVMVIDEIGRPPEVEAARTCKNRGVRLIASAHGDLRKLIKNPKLRGLIGGVESVTLGDIQAKLEAQRHNSTGISKTKTERAGPPTFDIIVELSRGEHHSWRVVRDAGLAVDCILDGQPYRTERRSRDPATGAIQIAFENA